MKENKIIPNNTMERGTLAADRDDLMNYFEQQVMIGELTDENIKELLEAAYRWGYKAGHKDTVNKCYVPLFAYVGKDDNGGLNVVFEEESNSKE